MLKTGQNKERPVARVREIKTEKQHKFWKNGHNMREKNKQVELPIGRFEKAMVLLMIVYIIMLGALVYTFSAHIKSIESLDRAVERAGDRPIRIIYEKAD